MSWIDKIHYRQNDAEFLAEGCIDIIKFKDVNAFARNDGMPDQGVTAIGDFVTKGKQAGEITPFDVADKLDEASKTLVNGAAHISAGNNAELRQTLGDFEAMGYMAQYYAHKIRGATYLSLYRLNGDEEDKQQAVTELEAGVISWESYAKVATTYYNPQLMARTRMLDWNALTENVKKDVTIAQNAKKGEPVGVSVSNKLWEVDKKKL